MKRSKNPRGNQHKQVKSRTELNTYRDFLSKSAVSPENTVDLNNRALLGSNESYYSKEIDSKNTEVVKTQFRYVAIDWIKKNIAATIIIPVLLLVFVWIAGSIIDTKIQLARFDERVSNIKEDVNYIQASPETKEILNLQIKTIENDLTLSKASIEELKKRMESLEKEVQTLK